MAQLLVRTSVAYIRQFIVLTAFCRDIPVTDFSAVMSFTVAAVIRTCAVTQSGLRAMPYKLAIVAHKIMASDICPVRLHFM